MHRYGGGVDLDPERPPLRAAILRQQILRHGGLWTSLEVVGETGSTNADVIAAARQGAPEGTVLVAEHQRSGRGRAGREWTSPARAGLAVSLLVRPGAATGQWRAAPAARWGWLPLLAGVALAETVARCTGVTGGLKWPNDLLVEGRKCAGILAEVAGDAVVIGVGLNTTLRAEEIPQPAAGGLPITSLALAGAATTDREALLLALLDRLGHWYEVWRSHSGDAEVSQLRATYLRLCATVGLPVRALLPGGTRLTGRAETVDAEGRLVLRTAHGTRALSAGDVTHVRPDAGWAPLPPRTAA